MNPSGPSLPSGAPRDYEALALALLDGVADDPPERALRIAGVYAAFYLEEPFLFRWGGVACFVALHLHKALMMTAPTPKPRGPSGLVWRALDRLTGGEEQRGLFSHAVHNVLAQANVEIYRRLLPDYLRFRDGLPVTSSLKVAFELLRRARETLPHDPAQADDLAEAGLEELCWREQVEGVQPWIATLDPPLQHDLAKVYQFRLGLDTAAPTRTFRGANPADLIERWTWTRTDVLPWCRAEYRARREWLTNDADRLRRMASVRLEHLPPRARPAP